MTETTITIADNGGATFQVGDEVSLGVRQRTRREIWRERIRTLRWRVPTVIERRYVVLRVISRTSFEVNEDPR